MSGPLYEVAVLTDLTSNRDVTWTIQPICTRHNCSIHPAFLSNKAPTNIHQTHNTTSWENHVSENNLIHQANSLLTLEGQFTENIPSNFETGQTISGYSSTDPPSTNPSDIFNSEYSWLVNPFFPTDKIPCVNSTQESVEWKETVLGVSGFSLGNIDTSVVASPVTMRDYDAVEIVLKDGEEFREIYDMKPDGREENGHSVEVKPNIQSFRDVLLSSCIKSKQTDVGESSQSDSEIIQSGLGHVKSNPYHPLESYSNETNSSMSLSVPESDESGEEFKTGTRSKMVGLLAHKDGNESADCESSYQNGESHSAPADMYGNGRTPSPDFDDAEDGHSELSMSVSIHCLSRGDNSRGESESVGNSSLLKSKTKKQKRRRKVAVVLSPPSLVLTTKGSTAYPFNDDGDECQEESQCKNPIRAREHFENHKNEFPRLKSENNYRLLKEELARRRAGGLPPRESDAVTHVTHFEETHGTIGKISGGGNTVGSRTDIARDEFTVFENNIEFPSLQRHQTIKQNLSRMNGSVLGDSGLVTNVTNLEETQNTTAEGEKDVSIVEGTENETDIAKDEFPGLKNYTSEFPSLQIHKINKHEQATRMENGLGQCNDSGVVTNVTNLDDTQNTRVKMSDLFARDVTKMDIAGVDTDVTSGVSSNFHSDISQSQHSPYIDSVPQTKANKRIVLQNAPYQCRIPHDSDFQPLQQIVQGWDTYLPELLQTPGNFESLLSISQRVVRIAVRKAYTPNDPVLANEYRQLKSMTPCKNKNDNTNQTMAYHYGTGFAFHINEHKMYIRTHSRIVSSPEDAKNALVQFNLQDVSCEGEMAIECLGSESEFQHNPHSQSCVFVCATPGELSCVLPLFLPVPVVQRQSVFNDSCYFTDSSAETSFYSSEENSSEQRYKIEQTKSLWETVEDKNNDNTPSHSDPTLPKHSNGPSNAPTRNAVSLSSPPDHHPLPNNAPTPEAKPIRQIGLEHDFHRREKKCEKDISSTWGGYLQEFSMFRNEIKSPVNRDACPDLPAFKDYNVPMAKKRDPNARDVLRVNGVDSGGFTPFAGYAADVIDSSLWKPAGCNNISPFVDITSPWEFASLLYAQNEHRDEYNEMFRPSVLKHFDCYGKQCDAETKRELFAPGRTSSQSNNDDDYDYDLLFMDQDCGAILPDDEEMKRIYDDFFADDPLDSDLKLAESTSNSSPFQEIAMIVSFPHGGSKMVASGKFSTSKHYGGEFYDTPTCMGSCGAPIISFTKHRKLFLTDIVHSGTTRENGKTERFGLACYHNNDMCQPQIKNLA